jgi:tripartite-type tricarboxylate transporter receptor subunit TctC
MALAIAVGLIGLETAQSFAETWPSRPIRMIIPYPAGGGTDAVARLVAKALSDRLQQAIVAENRGGANGAIGLQALAVGDADGTTIAVSSDTPLTVNSSLYEKLPYDPLRDFATVAGLVRFPGMLAVHPSVPARSVAELIALAKAKPGELTYASAGIGNFSHLAMELFAQKAAIKLLHVPYKGTGPASLALVAGDVQMGFNNVQTLAQSMQAGQVVALGVAEPTRMADLPNVPAVAESVPGFEMAPWAGIIVAAKTPKDIVDRLEQETLAVLHEGEVIKLLNDQYLTPMPLNAAQLGELIRSDLARWATVIKTAGIKIE